MRMFHRERHRMQRIGWLRAAVLGANDGVVSTASLVLGVAAAHTTHGGVVVGGAAGLVAGATAMAAGEYVSVSSQADTERADVALERKGLSADKEFEMEELAGIYVGRGIAPSLAKEVARQLMARDAIGTARPRRTWYIRYSHGPTDSGDAHVGEHVRPRSRHASFDRCHGSCDQSGPLRRWIVPAVPRSPGWVSCASRRRKRDERRATRNSLGRAGHSRDRRRRGSVLKGCVNGFRILL
jgi:hypothetical protein